MPLFSTLDLIALGWFLSVWAIYATALSAVEQRQRGLNCEMNRYRDVWMTQMLGRDMRMVDAQIAAALQNGTAFFKFGWAYRLYNYVAIMLGATPPASQKDSAEAKDHAARVGRLCEVAGRHFNRGQRAFFFALAYLGWFISPLLLMATSIAVALIMWRRQFWSDSRRALLEP